MVINTSLKARGDTEVLGAVVPSSIISVQVQTQHAGAPAFPAVLKCPMSTIQESLQAGPPASVMDHAHRFGLMFIPEQQALDRTGSSPQKLDPLCWDLNLCFCKCMFERKLKP